MNPKREWVEFRMPELERARVPKWQRLMFLERDSQVVYASAAVVASDMEVFLAASYDGVDMRVDDDGHVYAPTDWMGRNWPDMAEALNGLVAKVRQAVAPPHPEEEDTACPE